MNSKLQKRSLTGIKPSGTVHIGNYLGMIEPALALQGEYQCIYFIADLHALTTTKDPAYLRSQTLDLLATWIALGLNHKKQILFRQSDIPMVAEFSWYLSCCTGLGLLEKAHAYKEAKAKEKELNHGTFAYPVLMAADILMYDVDVVPVGKDQKQHVEFARDMAGSFNAVYGDGVLKLPEPMIREKTMTIPGLDGRKMSKSYENIIPLWAPEKELRKIVMSIKTDSTPLENPKSMRGSALGDIFAPFAANEQLSDLEARLNRGGLGWGHAKQELFEIINAKIQEPRNRYYELRTDESELQKVLQEGAEKAYEVAAPVIARVRSAVGIGPGNRCPTAGGSKIA